MVGAGGSARATVARLPSAMSSPVLRPRYPELDAYAETLPEGWASFAECEVNAALVGGLRERGAFDGLDALPTELHAAITGPLPASGWMPEVVSIGVFLAVRDARFPGPTGESDFLGWFEALNHEVLETQQQALGIGSHTAALSELSAVWARFHRGTTMTVTARTPRTAEIAFAHPARLFPPAWMEARRRMLVGALVRGGAVQPEVRATVDAARGTAFSLRWT